MKKDRPTNRVAILDTVVRNTFRDNPTALAAWVTASHIERPAKKAKTTAPTPPTA